MMGALEAFVSSTHADSGLDFSQKNEGSIYTSKKLCQPLCREKSLLSSLAFPG